MSLLSFYSPNHVRTRDGRIDWRFMDQKSHDPIDTNQALRLQNITCGIFLGVEKHNREHLHRDSLLFGLEAMNMWEISHIITMTQSFLPTWKAMFKCLQNAAAEIDSEMHVTRDTKSAAQRFKWAWLVFDDDHCISISDVNIKRYAMRMAHYERDPQITIYKANSSEPRKAIWENLRASMDGYIHNLLDCGIRRHYLWGLLVHGDLVCLYYRDRSSAEVSQVLNWKRMLRWFMALIMWVTTMDRKASGLDPRFFESDGVLRLKTDTGKISEVVTLHNVLRIHNEFHKGFQCATLMQREGSNATKLVIEHLLVHQDHQPQYPDGGPMPHLGQVSRCVFDINHFVTIESIRHWALNGPCIGRDLFVWIDPRAFITPKENRVHHRHLTFYERPRVLYDVFWATDNQLALENLNPYTHGPLHNYAHNIIHRSILLWQLPEMDPFVRRWDSCRSPDHMTADEFKREQDQLQDSARGAFVVMSISMEPPRIARLVDSQPPHEESRDNNQRNQSLGETIHQAFQNPSPQLNRPRSSVPRSAPRRSFQTHRPRRRLRPQQPGDTGPRHAANTARVEPHTSSTPNTSVPNPQPTQQNTTNSDPDPNARVNALTSENLARLNSSRSRPRFFDVHQQEPVNRPAPETVDFTSAINYWTMADRCHNERGFRPRSFHAQPTSMYAPVEFDWNSDVIESDYASSAENNELRNYRLHSSTTRPGFPFGPPVSHIDTTESNIAVFDEDILNSFEIRVPLARARERRNAIDLGRPWKRDNNLIPPPASPARANPNTTSSSWAHDWDYMRDRNAFAREVTRNAGWWQSQVTQLAGSATSPAAHQARAESAPQASSPEISITTTHALDGSQGSTDN